MADQFAGQCNAEIDPPDGDGLVYVVSNTDKGMKMACLGTKAEAKKLMSDWLAAYDDDDPLI